MSLHSARVYIAQARAFREREKALGWHGGFSAWLLDCAARARRDVLKPAEQIQHVLPIQRDLFA